MADKQATKHKENNAQKLKDEQLRMNINRRGEWMKKKVKK